jgi:hypothetical protein
VTPRPAAGKLTTSSPPVLVQIASQEPGGRERPADCSIHREGAMHAAEATDSVQPKQHSRTNVAELRRQAIAKADAVRGNAARLAGPPTPCLCKAPRQDGVVAARIVVVRSESLE